MQLILTETDVNNPIVKRTVAAFFGEETQILNDDEECEVQYDAKGTPWDERIHSETRTFNKDGTWRRRRNVDLDYYNSVMSELAAVSISTVEHIKPNVDPISDNNEIVFLAKEQAEHLGEYAVVDEIDPSTVGFGGMTTPWPSYLGEHPGVGKEADAIRQWIYTQIANGLDLTRIIEICNKHGASNLTKIDESNMFDIVKCIKELI